MSRHPFRRAPSVREQGRRQGLDRRSVLRGMLRGAAVAVALPPLELFLTGNGDAYACEGIIPRRFGLFFWGNGNRPERWTPTGEGDGDLWTLSDELAPLAAVKHRVTVVSGLEVKLPNAEPHGSGASGFLSGTQYSDGTFGGPSIDQVLADLIGAGSVFRSLETGGSRNQGQSFNGPHSQNPLEVEPLALYSRVFGDSFRQPGEGGLVDPRLALRRSVLSAVMDDAAELQGRLGASDRQRLEQHLDGIRDLENRLLKLEEDPPDLEACERPAEPPAEYPDVDGRLPLSDLSRGLCDLLAMAVACDQTRVFSHFLTDPVNDVLFPGATAGHHDLTHNEPGDQPEVHAITVQCMEELAYLVQALDRIPEGDGTVLDACAVLACSEVSQGQLHAIDELPVVVAGGACGSLRVGAHVRAAGENASKLMLTLIRAMDVPAGEFGTDEAHVTEDLGALWA